MTSRPLTTAPPAMSLAEARAALGERYGDVARAAADWASRCGKPVFAR